VFDFFPLRLEEEEEEEEEKILWLVLVRRPRSKYLGCGMLPKEEGLNSQATETPLWGKLAPSAA